MEISSVTTPFGRRSMTLGMLASQRIAETIELGIARNKWQLLRAVCEARSVLGVTDRALHVLDALMTFYPSDELSEERGLVVFPSNAQLSIRAKGMTAATLRRHLAVLVNAGLIVRKDSANGKRYARRDRAGEISDAFGFSLAPLLARAAEIETIAAQVIAEREILRTTKERLTICRRDIAKLISLALEESAAGDWEKVTLLFRQALVRLPRTATLNEVSSVLEELTMLREEIINRLEMCIKTQKMHANESQNERHKQNSKTQSIPESEPAFERKQTEKSEEKSATVNGEVKDSGISKQTRIAKRQRGEGGDLKSFPLGLVLQACPQVVDYGPRGRIDNWRELMSAAVVIRSMLGVSPSAYQDACSAMGAENAATVMACILERGGHINSAGGYLRDLTRRTEAGEFAIGPMLMSLARINTPAKLKSG